MMAFAMIKLQVVTFLHMCVCVRACACVRVRARTHIICQYIPGNNYTGNIGLKDGLHLYVEHSNEGA